MADITDPEAIRFCNDRIRVAVNRLNSAYRFAAETRDEFLANSMGEMLPNTADLVVDGSATDGRHPITGVNVNEVIALLVEYLNNLEANSNAKLHQILNVATNNSV